MESNGMLKIKTSLISSGTGEANGGDRIKIEINDTGCGIGAEDLKYIFVPFFTTKPDGTGLGLTNVKKIIEEHNGSIDVSSEAGKGTAFTISLPVKKDF